MYYNDNDKILIRKIPKNLIKPDGTLFINFDQSDINTIADYGYYVVRNDNNTPPTNNNVEDVDKRLILLEKPYVDVIRVWIDKTVPDNDNIKIEPTTEEQENVL
jgi:hypothetical protein